MAERPVFVPCSTGLCLIRVVDVAFQWNAGFAEVQKKKNVAALHKAAGTLGLSPLLEVSTKSELELGRRLSAFSLKARSVEHGEIPLESAYQGSKVFEKGGPYVDLYHVTPREAKKDPRLRSSGRIRGFRFDDESFPTRPTTAFYDWLYISTLFPHRDFLSRLRAYAGFTDIEFNPKRSSNCQARSCATMVAMMERGILEEATNTPADFVRILTEFLGVERTTDSPQRTIF